MNLCFALSTEDKSADGCSITRREGVHSGLSCAECVNYMYMYAVHQMYVYTHQHPHPPTHPPTHQHPHPSTHPHTHTHTPTPTPTHQHQHPHPPTYPQPTPTHTCNSLCIVRLQYTAVGPNTILLWSCCLDLEKDSLFARVMQAQVGCGDIIERS